MKGHRVTLFIVSHEWGIVLGSFCYAAEEVSSSVIVEDTQEVEIGEWSDEHPLNMRGADSSVYQ